MYGNRHFKRKALTLTEILIAAGVLSLFMTAVFSVYRSGSRAFVTGSWRVEEQKRLQNFLSALARDLGMANPALVRIESDGSRTDVQTTAVHVNAGAFSLNSTPVFLKTAGKSWTCLMAFSISYPFIDESATFSSPITFGRWSGISIWSSERKIRYIRTGDPDRFSVTPAAFPSGISDYPTSAIVGTGRDFVSDDYQNRDHTYDLSLEEIAIVASGTVLSNLTGLEILCRSARYEGARRTDAEILQSIAVQLASQSNVVTF